MRVAGRAAAASKSLLRFHMPSRNTSFRNVLIALDIRATSTIGLYCNSLGSGEQPFHYIVAAHTGL